MNERHHAAENGIAGKVLENACRIVILCDSGKITLDDAVETLPDECRRIVEHLLFTFYRHRKSVETMLNRFISRPPAAEVAAILKIAAVQTLFQHGISPESAVNVAVDAARRFHADKFVNAVLRNFRRAGFVPAQSADEILPDAVLKRWKKRFSAEELSALAALFTTEADFTYRILPGSEPLPGSRDIAAFGSFRFASAAAAGVLASAELKRGDYYIQDPATSFAVSLAADDAARAGRVLDLCAAPGGKTLMLGELCPAGCQVTASDISARRQKRTAENFALRGRDYQVVSGTPDMLDGKYDVILADLPCSNSGVFRKRPDALWHFSDKKMQEICKIQREIAIAALKLLAPGGILIISTCSIEPEENEALVKFICDSNPALVCEESRVILPDSDHDGAFAARLRLMN